VVKDSWNDMGSAKKAGLVTGIVIIVAVAAVLLAWTLNEPYAVLFGELEEKDAGRVMTQLESMKRDYRLDDSGSSILVPANEVHDIRIRLMSSGVPLAGGVGFEIFDDTGFGMTEFAQRINYQRALEGELTRTIMALEEVKLARVHIVMPEGGLFESQQGAPSASVTLFLKSGRRPAEGQIRGVQNLVAAAVPRLESMQVMVTDDGGLPLSRNDGDAPVERVSGQLEKKMEVENYLAQKVNSILSRAFGPNQAMVSLDVVLNFNESTTTTESIVPNAGIAEGGVLRRRESRAPGSSDSGNSTTEVEYQFGRSVEQLVERPGGIVRLSVGVVVPAATSEERRQAIAELVAAAVGLNRNRGDAIAIYSLAAPTAADAASQSATAVPLSDATLVSPPVHAGANNGVSRTLDSVGMDQSTLLMLGKAVGFIIVVFLILWIFNLRRVPRVAPSHRLSGPEREQFVTQVQGWLNEGRAKEEGGTLL
jgi:flagellar M-ring protein FliF